jgi:hypothetical protein
MEPREEKIFLPVDLPHHERISKVAWTIDSRVRKIASGR